MSREKNGWSSKKMRSLIIVLFLSGCASSQTLLLRAENDCIKENIHTYQCVHIRTKQLCQYGLYDLKICGEE